MTTQCQGLHACTGLYASCCFAGGHGGAQAMTTQPLQCQGLNADPAGLPVQCKARAQVSIVGGQSLCQTHFQVFQAFAAASSVPGTGMGLARGGSSPDAIDVPVAPCEAATPGAVPTPPLGCTCPQKVEW